MISYLSGRAIAADTVLVGGVGYGVATVAPLPVGQDVELWVHTAVRENDISLYGFASIAERSLFACLTRVAGVGPRVALTLLGLGAPLLASAIAAGDAAVLARASGVGPKKAAAILTSLSVPADVLAALRTDEQSAAAPARPVGDELLATLVGLGHDQGRSAAALAHVREVTPDAPAPVALRAALRHLAAGLVPVAS